ncbi:MAG: MFS transporter [Chloroflexota bacterium]
MDGTDSPRAAAPMRALPACDSQGGQRGTDSAALIPEEIAQTDEHASSTGASTDESPGPDPLPGPLARIPALRSLGYPSFRWLWGTALLIGFGNWMQRLTVGWLVLDQTESVFLTAAVHASRIVPNVVFGPIAGAIADRLPRRRLLIMTSAGKASVAVGLAAVAGIEVIPIWAVFLLVFTSGVTNTIEIPSAQALVVDITGRKDASNGIALFSVATRTVAAFGALAGGVLIEIIGAGQVFLLGAAAFAAGALAASRVKAAFRAAVWQDASGVLRNAVDGIRTIFRLPVAAMLLGMAFLVEILGFSFQSVLPAVADRVLEIGPAGLGTLTSMAAIGGLAGSLGVTALADMRRKGVLMSAVSLVFGVALIGLGVSELFPLSLAVVLVAGMMAAAFDALQWTLLQANVPDEMRGRVMGGWIFAIGFGWLGSLQLGAVSELAGVQAALALNGLMLGVLGAGVLLLSGRMRRLGVET